MLQLENVRVARSALQFEDLCVERGEKLLLLGPSGSGKTTLLSVLAGLLPPLSGRVLWEGADLYAMPPARRDRLRGTDFGFVFQTLHLIPSLTLAQNVGLAARDQAEVAPLLDRLSLGGKGGRRPHALSQGEQQRGAIARAVIHRPKIILADEPTAALDDDNARKVIDLMCAQARETGAALLVATHDRRIASAFDRVLTLPHKGDVE